MHNAYKPDNAIWMLAYFRQIYPDRVEITEAGVQLVPLSREQVQVEALHLGWSADGRHWEALNGNRPTHPDMWVRDPFVARGPDGWFHLVGTGREQKTIQYARSKDLIAWEDERLLPMMASEPRAVSVWAPEFLYDPTHASYFVFWSSSFGQHGWDDSRIWQARTTDFLNFTLPALLFDPGYTVIDATILPYEGRHYLFYKDERFGWQHGEHRFIKMAVGAELEGPYELVTEEAITPSITEGPSVMRLGDRWQLVYDYCMDNAYGASVSTDLLHWQLDPGVSFPANARHGSVFWVTPEELAALRAHFG
jgi:hypothetical protein